MRVSAIVVAAGRGARLKRRTSKALILIKGKPVIAYSLEALQRNRHIREIIAVANSVNQEAIRKIVKRCGFTKAKKVVLGGIKRQDSVACGLRQVDPNAELVLIHDAARPFLPGKLLDKLIEEADKEGGAILAVPVKATVKRGILKLSKNRRKILVKGTIDRKDLWEVQTPQVFHKELIFEAYRRFGKIPATDDAMLAEKMKARVSVVEGSYDNIKVTTPVDLAVASIIARRSRLY